MTQSHKETRAYSSKVTLVLSDNFAPGLSGNIIISVMNILNFLEQLACSTCLEKMVFADGKIGWTSVHSLFLMLI